MFQAFDLGFQEIQLQAWGRDQREIESVGSEIAAISDRVVVKIPVTAEGTAAAASLKRQKAPVTLTGRTLSCFLNIADLCDIFMQAYVSRNELSYICRLYSCSMYAVPCNL